MLKIIIIRDWLDPTFPIQIKIYVNISKFKGCYGFISKTTLLIRIMSY